MGSSYSINGDISGRAVAIGDGARAGDERQVGESRLRRSRRPPSSRVFVVHGRDLLAARAVFDLLRDLGLEPWEWEEGVADLGQASPYSGDVVAHAVKLARAAVVVLTPDDEVRLHPELWKPDEHGHETRFTGQPRPNVLIELGMVLAAYPERVVIAEFGALRQVNDVNGRNVVRFGGDPGPAVTKVASRLENAGCDVRRAPGWDRADRFTGLPAYRRTPQPEGR